SPSTTAPNSPANAGSHARITAVRDGDTYRWAAVWIRYPSADAASPVIRTAHTTFEAVGATRCSVRSDSTAQGTAATHICTAVSPAAEYLGETRASTTICTANANAAPRTMRSPARGVQPFRAVSRNSPTVASTTPAHTAGP